MSDPNQAATEHFTSPSSQSAPSISPSVLSEPLSIYTKLQKDKYFPSASTSTSTSTSNNPQPQSQPHPTHPPSNTTPPQSPSRSLLSLPTELLSTIISHLIASDCELYLSQRPHSFALAHTCRWLNTEVSQQFWRRAVPLNEVRSLGVRFEFWPGVRGLRWGFGERVMPIVAEGKGEGKDGEEGGDGPGVKGSVGGNGRDADGVWTRVLHVVARDGDVYSVKCALEPWKDLRGLKSYEKSGGAGE